MGMDTHGAKGERDASGLPVHDHDLVGPESLEPVRWSTDRKAVVIIDQTELPEAEVRKELASIEQVEEAIRSLRVRGAPLIGVTAAMAVAALARAALARGTPPAQVAGAIDGWAARLAATRPTAVNLEWALRRVRDATRAWISADGDAGRTHTPTATLADALSDEAAAIREDDRRTCRQIGEHALGLLADGQRVLTHCNAGALATCGVGSALAPVYLARERGWRPQVVVGETRPLLQGSRLTAWELARFDVDVTVITDDMAGALFRESSPDAVLVGADRIAANGDVANKIGTYTLAVLARHHGVPFYVLAPTSSVDASALTGADIPVEMRSPDEVRRGFGKLTAPAECAVWTPAFDVTPAALVDAIVTEWGVARPPYGPALENALRAGRVGGVS